MRNLPITGEPVWDLEFDDQGRPTALTAADLLAEVDREGVEDLFVFSHGWGTSKDSARNLYDAMFPLIAQAATDAGGPGGGRGFVGVYWPSLWFPPTEASVPTSVGSPQADAGAVTEARSGSDRLSGRAIAASLAPGFLDPAQRDTVTAIGELIDEAAREGDAEPDDAKGKRLLDIHGRLRSLAPTAVETEDSGETSLLLAGNPARAYPLVAEAFGSAPPGSATQGIGDWFHSAISGAKDALRVLSYSLMKARAGDVGRRGLGPILAELHARRPQLRAHLIGHSFGARLVSFALAGMDGPAASPVGSLVLLQGAFSHWTFAHAQDNPFGSPGALNGVADRVHGPLVATFSPFDYAVGVWYPKASFLTREDAQAQVTDRWGGMGADGFQAVPRLENRILPDAPPPDYRFAPGGFYRVDASRVVNDVVGEPFAGAHSDIRKRPVADLIVAAARAHA